MQLSRTLLLTASLSMLMSIGFAQQQQPPDTERDRMKPTKSANITGCLTKGDLADQYVLTDVQSGSKITVTGDVPLEKHNNHTVRLTGMPSEDGTKFVVSKVEHISDTCTGQQ